MAKEFLNLHFDFTGLYKAVDKLENAVLEAVQPAAQAGAQVLYDQARQNVPVGTEDHVFYGTSYKGKRKKNGQRSEGKGTTYNFPAGTLRDSIYQVLSKDYDKNTAVKKTYHVAWNHKKAPYGFMVEYGTIRTYAVVKGKDGKFYTTSNKRKDGPKVVPGKAFLRRTWDSHNGIALEAMRAEMKFQLKDYAS